MSAGASPEASRIAEIRREAANSVLVGLQEALAIIDNQSIRMRALQDAIALATKLLDVDLQRLKGTLEATYGDSAVKADTNVGGAMKSAEERFKKLNDALTHARQSANVLVLRHVESTKLQERKERFKNEGKIALLRANQGDPLKELKSLWEEGLDLLSGLCLRNEGLDGGLCRFADAIIAEIRWTGIKAITVPGRGGPGHLTSIIHLRFPEWTVWALPLTAHELWHLGRRNAAYPIGGNSVREGNSIRDAIFDTLSRKDPEAEARLKDSIENWSDPELQRCLADVFGVHVMGPAYACTAIWLVLDPHEKESKQRALSILHALASGPNAYSDIHNKLEAQWRQASKESGVGELRHVEWIDALLKYLEENVSQFYLDRWREVRKPWCDALQSGEIHALDVEPTDFRYALTAAWKTRIEWPEKSAVISKNCLDLCEKILSRTLTQTLPGLL